MIKALIFDCFGVLYRDNLSMLYEVVPKEKQQELHDIVHATDHGFISRADYFEKIAELSGKETSDIREIENRQFSRNETLIARAKELKSDFKIGLLSNIGDETMDRLFPEPERSELFDAFVLSSEVGLIKPAVELFQVTAERLGYEPEECLMIDDIPVNVGGARLAGMQAVLFTTNYEFEQNLERLLGGQSHA